jgi:hypothetical protein
MGSPAPLGRMGCACRGVTGMDQGDDDDYVLSSGRRFYANRGLISINQNLEVSEGYDGEVWTGKWSGAEKRELADFMIALWRRFGGYGSESS